MSNSTPRAWRPEIRRRPAMKIARAAPTASTSAAIMYRSSRLLLGERVLEPGCGEIGDRERGGLGRHCEHDRDDQRPLVRLQEAEQPDEC